MYFLPQWLLRRKFFPLNTVAVERCFPYCVRVTAMMLGGGMHDWWLNMEFKIRPTFYWDRRFLSCWWHHVNRRLRRLRLVAVVWCWCEILTLLRLAAHFKFNSKAIPAFDFIIGARETIASLDVVVTRPRAERCGFSVFTYCIVWVSFTRLASKAVSDNSWRKSRCDEGHERWYLMSQSKFIICVGAVISSLLRRWWW